MAKQTPTALSSTPAKPPSKPECAVVLQHLYEREWGTLRALWLAHPPSGTTLDLPHPDPAQDLPSLHTALQPYADNKLDVKYRDIATPIPGLREAILLDSIFLIAKGAHVLGAAQIHIDKGMCSWSTSSAYQSAFFLMKGIAGLLGIAVAEVNDLEYIVDVCTIGLQKTSSKFHPPMIVRACKVRSVEHREWWSIFQRMLRITVIPDVILPELVGKRLDDLQLADFASKRNRLHYKATSWPLDDLQVCKIYPDFATDAAAIRSGTRLNPSCDDFSIALAMHLARMASMMLNDLSQDSNVIGDEYSRLERWLSEDFNSHYSAAFA